MFSLTTDLILLEDISKATLFNTNIFAFLNPKPNHRMD